MRNANFVFWNLGTAQLIEKAIQRREGLLASGGGLVVRTGDHTGRSPRDKFVVRDQTTETTVNWGSVNQPFTPEQFDRLYGKLLAYLQARDLFVQDCFAGADPQYRIPIRVVTELAWHNLFARQLFVRANPAKTGDHVPEFTVIDAPGFRANAAEDGTNSDVFVIVNFTRKLVIVGGTAYAGEMKKAIFSVLNYFLPTQDVLPMHCSANVGADGGTALFFGLSGTGKTTLSADPERSLIGDDEHGWSHNGTFNFEGGCYAKVIHLSPELEPDIYATTQMFGTILENVELDPLTKKVLFDSQKITENTRASYPLSYIRNHVPSGRGGHPKNVIFLTADAFGVLPPIAKLSREQAMYYFLSGYTAKVAGTERGVTEPQATFSACFGAVFLVWHPTKYAQMLGELLDEHKANVWLINTGWTGGAYGVGTRMKLAHTRAMVRAVLAGKLTTSPLKVDPVFGLAVPQGIDEVPAEVLDARESWKDVAAYDAQAKKLSGMFRENIKKFGAQVGDAILAAGPKG